MASRYALKRESWCSFSMIKLQVRTHVFSLIVPGVGESKIYFGSAFRAASE